MDDTDYLVSREDFKDLSVIGEIKGYLDKVAPDKSVVFERLLSGERVAISEIQSATDPLFDELVKHLHIDGQQDDPAILKLESLLTQLGSQL